MPTQDIDITESIAENAIETTENKANELKEHMRTIMGDETYDMGATLDIKEHPAVQAVKEKTYNATQAIDDVLDSVIEDVDDADGNMDDNVGNDNNEADESAYQHIHSFEAYKRYLVDNGYDLSEFEYAINEVETIDDEDYEDDEYDTNDEMSIADELEQITPVYMDGDGDIDTLLDEVEIMDDIMGDEQDDIPAIDGEDAEDEEPENDNMQNVEGEDDTNEDGDDADANDDVNTINDDEDGDEEDAKTPWRPTPPTAETMARRTKRRHKSKAAFISPEQVIPAGAAAFQSDDSFPSEQEFNTIEDDELMDMFSDVDMPDDELLDEIASLESDETNDESSFFEEDAVQEAVEEIDELDEFDEEDELDDELDELDELDEEIELEFEDTDNDENTTSLDEEGWIEGEEPADLHDSIYVDDNDIPTDDELAEQRAMDEYYSPDNQRMLDEEENEKLENAVDEAGNEYIGGLYEMEQLMHDQVEDADGLIDMPDITDGTLPMLQDDFELDEPFDDNENLQEELSDAAFPGGAKTVADNIVITDASEEGSLIEIDQVVTSRGTHPVNEDFIYADKTTVVVADGATTLSGSRVIPATWVIEHFIKTFPSELARREEETAVLYAERTREMDDDEKRAYRDEYIRSMMVQALDDAIANLTDDYKNEFDIQDDDVSSYPPSSAVAIVHIFDGASAYLILGDCSIIAFLKDDCEMVIGQDAELLRLDRETHEYIAILQELLGVTYREAAEHIATQAVFIAHRKMMNVDGGYTVVAPGMPHIDENQIIIQDCDDVNCILMHTDGLEWTYDDEELDMESEDAELVQIVNDLRTKELLDRDFAQMPRFKMSDDASAIRFRLR